MIVYLENAQEIVKITYDLEQLLTTAMNVAAKQEKIAENTEVDVTIVTDAEIWELNKNYRQVDHPTDVLSFALDEGDEEPEYEDASEAEHLLGDVIISAETASRQALEFGHGLNREIVYLAVHGLLHLLGYDHLVEADKVVMRRREEEILRECGLSEEIIGG